MMSTDFSSTVEARDTLSLHDPEEVPNASNEEDVLNPTGRASSDVRVKKGLSRPKRPFIIGSLNCRSLTSNSSREELNKHINTYNIAITCIQEHRFIHNDEDPDIIAHNIGKNTMFTASATKNDIGASVGGVGLIVQTHLLPLLTKVTKVSDRIITAVFKGNPKTVVINCYAPHNHLPVEEVEQFYHQLNVTVSEIPSHVMLIIGGDFNAQIKGNFSYHQTPNRNGVFMEEFLQQHNLLAGNTIFQKPKRKLWTWRHPAGYLSQIDYIIYRKRWRNSVHDCQAHTSSTVIGGDHNIVTAKINLSLRAPRKAYKKQLYWQAIREDENLGRTVDSLIADKFDSLPVTDKSYTTFVSICNEVGEENLPKRPRQKAPVVESSEMSKVRDETLKSSVSDVQHCQKIQRSTFDQLEDERINQTLATFDNNSNPREAWRLVKELSGKRRNVVYIQGEDRLATWKEHFQKLLSADNPSDPDVQIDPIFDIHPEISIDQFSGEEVDKALSSMKPGKAPGLDGLTLDLWKLPKVRNHLRVFCIETFDGHRPDEWGISGIVPVPKKGNLTICDNYRGISLTQIAAKVYNRMILNRIRPVIDQLLRSSQNGFRQSRSTASHIMALRRIVEEVLNHKKEAVLVFIDFKKAFDSIDRTIMLKILLAYGIPLQIVEAIKVMYVNTSALVMTPEGNTDLFSIDTGVLQGDPLAPFLFVICLDYALRKAISPSDGITLKRRQSSRHPEEVLPDLAYADDIALMENTLKEAEDLLHRVEVAAQTISLFLNAVKTKFMHLNPTSDAHIFALDGSEIEKVDDFLYLGSYTNTAHDIDTRIGKAWGALNALSKVWVSPIKKITKMRLFKASVESILLYGSDSWTLTKSLTKRIDGTYTRMLRKVQNISWKAHITNNALYGSNPRLSDIIKRKRLALAGHAIRHDEPVGRVLLWKPDVCRRVGRPNITLKKVLENDTGLEAQELRIAMLDRVGWKKNFVMSPAAVGCG